MGLLNFLRGKTDRSPNITAYVLSSISNGRARALRLGIIPPFADSYERTIRDKHRPAEPSYINDTIIGVSVILYWTAARVDAICFLSADEARSFPGFEAIA